MGNGVIHVGGHRGEEVPDYLAEGRSPIILFEPQVLGWEPPPGVQLERWALGSYNGLLRMYIPHHLHDTPDRDTQSTSGLRLIDDMARKIGWTPTPKDEIVVPITMFSTWAQATGFEDGSCSLLNIDVQGMELQVLAGFSYHLEHFTDVVIECSEEPLYEGGARADDVCYHLDAYGFDRVTPIVAHGDITFRKRSQ